jgi:DNA polymerase-3 subunit delta'
LSEPDDIPASDRVDGAPHPRQTPLLFGQDEAEARFLDAFASGRLHHGWLITGPRGVGKATLAWRIARFLLAQPLESAGDMFGGPAIPDSLDTDRGSPVQRHITALSEARLFLCRRPWDDKAERLKKDITVDEIRRLKSFFNLSSTDGGRRVVIIDAADEMNNSAANALLKILEEPPAQTSLLLIAHRPLSLLPTIRSRCRTLACGPLGPGELAQALAQAGFDPGDQTSALSILAAGSVGEAIRLLSGEGLDIYTALIGLFSDPRGLSRPSAVALAESCTGKAGQTRYDTTLRLAGIFLHRLARAGVDGPPLETVTPQEKDVLERLSPNAYAARGWAELAQSLSERTAHAKAVNLDPASVILDMFLKIEQTASALRAA